MAGFEWKRCNRCRVELDDDDRVVIAPIQLVMTGINGQTDIDDGAKRVWHEAHWPGDSPRYVERQRGRWGDLRPPAGDEPAIW